MDLKNGTVFFVFLLIVTTFNSIVYADLVDDAEQQNIRIIRDIDDEQERQFEIDRSQKGKQKQKIDIDSSLIETKTTASLICHDITEIIVVGITALKKYKIEKIISPHKNTCMGVNKISRLMGLLTNEYIRSGYITSRVYLPPQNLSSGTLTLNAEEGRISKLLEESDSNISFMNTFPTKEGAILNLRDIEQGLDQLHRLASNSAMMKIEPGENVGASNVLINNKKTSPFFLNLSIDNHGSEPTGKKQKSISVALDNPLTLNDYISITYKEALLKNDKKPWQDNSSLSFSYVIPWGYNTFYLGKSNSSYQSTINASSGAQIKSNGLSKNDYAQLERVVFRNQKNKVKLSFKGTRKKTKTYIADQFISVSSRKLSFADFDLNWSHQRSDGSIVLNLGLSKGTRWFDAVVDPGDLALDMPRAQSIKYKFSLYSTKYFSIFDKPVVWMAALTSQYSKDALYGSEQISIGGLYTIRGFQLQTLTGNTGFYLRNDLVFTLPKKIINGTVKPYIAFDVGSVDAGSSAFDAGSLAGTGIGLKYYLKNMSADFVYTQPVYKPKHFRDSRGIAYFRVALNF